MAERKYHRGKWAKEHPRGRPFAYCVCGEAIVTLSDVWWHLSTYARGSKEDA